MANLPYESLLTMGLDYDSLKAIKDDIILTTVSCFGSEGPYSTRVGFDGIAQVMCGSVYLGGSAGQPVKSEAPWVDFGTASLTAFGTMAALMERNKTGRGQMVEGALLRTALTFHNSMLVEQAVIETDREPIGNRGYNGGPSDIFKTKDGWIIVQVLGDPLFKRWTDLMGEAHWHDDERFANDAIRGDHGEIISERMSRWSACSASKSTRSRPQSWREPSRDRGAASRRDPAPPRTDQQVFAASPARPAGVRLPPGDEGLRVRGHRAPGTGRRAGRAPCA